MSNPISGLRRSGRWMAAAAVVLVAACGEPNPAAVPVERVRPDLPAMSLLALDCSVVVATRDVSCGAPRTSGARHAIIGGQGTYVQLTASNFFADPGDLSTEIPGTLEFDVTVQNLLNEAIGTPDGATADTAGIKVFFYEMPTTTQGVGAVWLNGSDGEGLFLGAEQPYFRYDEVLARNETSAPRRWSFSFDPLVERFAFKVYVAAEVQPLLVINEFLANPGGLITDASGEWFEVYNAGTLPVQMQGMLIADSANSGRRPYHRIASPLEVPAGGYAVLGNTTNTTNNGGVPVDYAYGSALAFANSLDALKISRAYGATDTLTIDRVVYANVPAVAPRAGPISAVNGESRELKNPSLDNTDLDGANWAYPLATAVYGPGGLGTPGAQNSTFTP